VSNRTKNQRNKHLDPHSIYEIVLYYVGKLEEEFPKGFGAHGARAQAITNALKNGKDLNEVREWAGHANIATTALYDKREHPPEDSPSHSVRY
jgi:integrase